MVLLIDVLRQEWVCKQLDEAFQISFRLRVDRWDEVLDSRIILKGPMEYWATLILQVVCVWGEAWRCLVEDFLIHSTFHYLVQWDAELVYGFELIVVLLMITALVNWKPSERALERVSGGHEGICGKRCCALFICSEISIVQGERRSRLFRSWLVNLSSSCTLRFSKAVFFELRLVGRLVLLLIEAI